MIRSLPWLKKHARPKKMLQTNPSFAINFSDNRFPVLLVGLLVADFFSEPPVAGT